MIDSGISKTSQIPIARFKRSHRKSRLGCRVCKSRHIKCDEARPHCLKCRNRGLQCSYEESIDPSPIRSDSNASPTSTHSLDEACSPASDPSQDCEAADTHLVRHFFSHTMETLIEQSGRNETISFWRVVVPTLSYTSLAVRHAMLVIAALCSYFDAEATNDSTLEDFKIAEHHGVLAINQLGQQLQTLTPSTVNPVLTCSRILGLAGFAFFRIRRSNGFTLRDPEAWIWLHMLRGVLEVQRSIIGLGMGMSIDELILRDMKPEILPSATPHVCQAQYKTDELFDFVTASRSKRFSALHAVLEQHELEYSPGESVALHAAISELEAVTEHICGGEVHSTWRAVCTWPCNMPANFVLMLQRNEAFSLSIYAHWLMLVVLIEHYWWVGDMGRAGLSQVIQICSETWIADTNVLCWPQRMLKVSRVTKTAGF